MRYVCERTGGLAALFAYRIDPAGLVHAEVDTSWQFWNDQRRLLLQLCNHIYLGVRSSLAIPFVVRQGIDRADLRLPTSTASAPAQSSSSSSPSRPPELVLPSEVLARYKLTGVSSETVWQGVPDVALRRYEDAIVQDFVRKTEHLRHKQNVTKLPAPVTVTTTEYATTPQTIPLGRGRAFDNPAIGSATLFSPTSTAVATPAPSVRRW